MAGSERRGQPHPPRDPRPPRRRHHRSPAVARHRAADPAPAGREPHRRDADGSAHRARPRAGDAPRPPAWFLRTPALMGYLSGAPLVPCFIERIGRRPIHVLAGAADLRRPRRFRATRRFSVATQQFADQLGARMRRHPSTGISSIRIGTSSATRTTSATGTTAPDGNRIRMDPLSHVICSRTLLEIGRQRPLHRGTTAAAMVAALAPDSDAVLMPAGWDIYLRVHEVGTHSLVGGLVTACGVAVLVRLVARSAPWRGVAVAAVIGTLSHLALDALSGARLQLFWPLQVRTALPLVAMADPWLVAIFLAAAIGLRLAPQRARLVSVTVLGIAVAFLAFKAMGLRQRQPGGGTRPGSGGPPRRS